MNTTDTLQTNTLVALLQERARATPLQLAYAFLVDGDIAKPISLNYQELQQRVQALAVRLLQLVEPGDRALLLYPQGVDYVIGFLGCLYAGVIAIPVFPPRGKSADARIQAIADDAKARIALSKDSIVTKIDDRLNYAPHLKELQWLATDTLDLALAASWQPPDITTNTLAFLQYTSGSTGIPKGVMVSHGNLLHNSAYTASIWKYDAASSMVTWLPIFHDMGLIFGIIQPLYKGFPCYLMSPAAFVQRPLRWLRAISHFRATHSGAPNFAYDLCVQKISPEQRATLDLSNWRMSLNAAEPVRADTFQAFIKAFAPCGLEPTTVCHGYGLAEGTLIVAGAWQHDLPVYLNIQSAALEQHRVVVADESDQETTTLVGSGYPAVDAKIAIADPQTLTQCPPDVVGEVLVLSPSVAHGYWQRPEASAETFQAYLQDTGEGPFLRTGDLGFLRDGELFVTGRIKDVIIIRGNNYYPQDIEYSVEKCHPALRAGGYGAAFSVMVDEHEHLVVVQEVERLALKKLAVDEVMGAIRQAVSEEHDLQVYAILLLRPASIPRTSSGKIQRSSCKAEFINDGIKSIAAWQQQLTNPPVVVVHAVDVTRDAIQTWLLGKVAELLKITPAAINVHEPLARYGIDSVTAVGLSGELEVWLDRPIASTLVYDYPNIEAIANFLTTGQATNDPLAWNATKRPTAVNDDIAIIGLGCRFPGANDAADFLQLLQNGVDAITQMPAFRRHLDGQNDDAAFIYQGGFLQDVELFDPEFFGISGRETEQMDPQQRLLLEVGFEALEHAGIAFAGLKGSQTGVFIGISTNDYTRLQVQRGAVSDAYSGTGTAFSIAANRLSYVLDLRGPSMAIDTACSSSLVALHQACLHLRQGECNLALAGGVNLILSPDFTRIFAKAGMLAADGRCKTFDASADGYVRGEGAGIIVLKRLADAKAAKDNILAVIKGSAVNQDGRSNGLTAPNGLAQQTVIRQALANAGVAGVQVGLVEAHGTGTTLGDPIEMSALKAVFGADRASPCWIGSAKTNIGHLEAAAGIAGVIKTVLSVKHAEIFPHLHLTKLNPLITISDTQLKIPTQREPWPNGQAPRFAGVSSFGFGGTNAHVVLASYHANAVSSKSDSDQNNASTTSTGCEQLFTLSALDDTSLQAMARRYLRFLQSHEACELADICLTANTGRTHLARRLAIIAATTTDLHQSLSSYITGNNDAAGLMLATVSHGVSVKKAFLFTGQGSQYVGMAAQLYQTHKLFRQTIDRCNAIMLPYLEKPLIDVILPKPGSVDNEQVDLDLTHYTQPALFAVEYALAKLWQSFGIHPDVVMGHSVGEYVAACIAGVFSLEDGLLLIAQRGRLMHALPSSGVMVVVDADEARVALVIQPYADVVSIAAVNTPANTVIAGERQALAAIVGELAVAHIKATYLNVSHAFHSPLMEPMLADFAEVAAKISYSAPKLDIISNITGQLATAMASAEYWVKHVRHAVRFADSMQTLQTMGCQVFIEIGPRPVLLGMGRRCLADMQENLWLPSLRQTVVDWQQMFASVAALYLAGHAVDWSGIAACGPKARRISLPTYPFQRQQYWLGTGSRRSAGGKQSNLLHPLWNVKTQSPLLKEIIFETQFSKTAPAFLADHVIFEKIIVPGASHIAMLLGTVALHFDDSSCALENILLQQALVIAGAETRTIQVVLTPDTAASNYSAKLISWVAGVTDDTWIEHVNAVVIPQVNPADPVVLETLQARCQQHKPGMVIYQAMAQHQFQLGSDFRWVESLWQGDNEVLCRMILPENFPDADGYQLHPGLLDSCFQPFFLFVAAEAGWTFVPFTIARFAYYRHPGTASQLWCHVQFQAVAANPDQFLINTRLFDEAGQVIAEAIGLELRKAKRGALLRSLDNIYSDWLYEVNWQAVTAGKDDKSPITQQQPSAWLVFTDRTGVGFNLVEQLQAKGERCIVVTYGDNYEDLGRDLYCVNPELPEGFISLLDASFGVVTEAGNAQSAHDVATPRLLSCRGIVHLWSLDTTFAQILNISGLLATQIIGCGSVLHLTQAVIKREWVELPRLCLVTRGAQAIDSIPYPLQAQQNSLWGLGHVIALEHPDLRCLRVDLDPSDDSDHAVQLFTNLWQEDREDQVAYRGNTQYVARLVRINMRKEAPQQLLSENGSYLICGGLGGLGLKVAAWLAGEGARHLFLIGRTVESESAQQQINQFESIGVRVTVMAADVADPDSLAPVFAKIKASAYPLRGIMHTAGVLDDGLLQRQDWNKFCRVMAPKVAGAWNLHRLSQEFNLDFFVYFSSSTALLGAKGQGNYAAANAFLDGLIHYRRRLGLPGLSVNWGPWAEVGMAAQLNDREQARLAALGFGFIKPQQGMDVLERLLGQDTVQAAVLPVNWTKFLQQFQTGKTEPPLFGEFTTASANMATSPSQFLEKLQSAPLQQRRGLLGELVRTQISKVLRIRSTQIQPRQRLFDMGLDSLMAVELKDNLQTSLGQTLRATLVFDYPTPQALIDYLFVDVLGFSEDTQLDAQLAVNAVPEVTETALKLETLSAEDMGALLDQKLAELDF